MSPPPKVYANDIDEPRAVTSEVCYSQFPGHDCVATADGLLAEVILRQIPSILSGNCSDSQLHVKPVITSLRSNFAASRKLWLVSPFVTVEGVAELLDGFDVSACDLRLITRLSERDFLSGVSQVAALLDFQSHGGTVHGHEISLHAKLFLTDSSAFVGSSNITGGGLLRNVEIMHHVDLQELEPWFEALWNETRVVDRQELFRIKTEIDNSPLRDTELNIYHFRDFAVPSSTGNLTTSLTGKLNTPRQILKLNGFAGGRHRLESNHIPSTSVGIQGAQCFSKQPNMKVGDLMYLCTMYKSDAGASKRAIYGRGIVDRARPDVDTMPPNLFEGVPDMDKPDRIEEWSRIIWLRDVEIVNCRLERAPNPYDPSTFEHPLLLSSTRQGSHFFPSRSSMDEIDAALNKCFFEHGKVAQAQPQSIWWNDYLRPERQLSRKYFETLNP